jgi:hypothetical protein
VLDTNVFSYLFKDDGIAEKYRTRLFQHTPCITFQSLAELYQWMEQNDWGEKRRQELETFLHNFLVLPYDNEVARAWARIRVECKQKGRPISCQDAWIAACTLRHLIPLVTHDPRDFESISGLEIITELEGYNSGAL